MIFQKQYWSIDFVYYIYLAMDKIRDESTFITFFIVMQFEKWLLYIWLKTRTLVMNKYIHLMNQSYNILTLIDNVGPVKHWCMINFSRTRILSCSLSLLSSLHLRFISHERDRESYMYTTCKFLTISTQATTT